MSVSAAALPEEAQGRLKAVFPDKSWWRTAPARNDISAGPGRQVLINNAESQLGDQEPGDTIVVVHEGQPAVPSQIRCKRD
jgi:hypothetical protein